jgi:benzoylformate decarboxylase
MDATVHRLPPASPTNVTKPFGPHFGLSHTIGTKLPALDFVALAAGHGIDGCRVDRPDALEAVLRNALGAQKPMLVEVAVT